MDIADGPAGITRILTRGPEPDVLRVSTKLETDSGERTELA